MSVERNPDAEFLASGVGPSKSPARLSRARWSILLGLLLPFTALTYRALHSGSPSDVQHRPILLTTVATITGPFVGAIARRGQGCCLEFSIFLATLCGPVLALGLLAQVVRFPFRRGRRTARLLLWGLGWFIWFGGGVFSFTHALN